MYLQAYEEQSRGDNDAARKLYQAVENMLTPGDEYYEKAKARLTSM